MKLSYHPRELKLKHSFATARGTRDAVSAIVVELEHDEEKPPDHPDSTRKTIRVGANE